MSRANIPTTNAAKGTHNLRATRSHSRCAETRVGEDTARKYACRGVEYWRSAHDGHPASQIFDVTVRLQPLGLGADNATKRRCQGTGIQTQAR